MPLKRIKAKARSHRITPEVLAAYQAGDHLLLHRRLGLNVWEASPLDVDSSDQPSPWPEGSGGARSWPQAQHLRAELEAARETEAE
jgi:hypothetical protein